MSSLIIFYGFCKSATDTNNPENILLRLHEVTINEHNNTLYSFESNIELIEACSTNKELPNKSDLDFENSRLKIKLYHIPSHKLGTRTDPKPIASIDLELEGVYYRTEYIDPNHYNSVDSVHYNIRTSVLLKSNIVNLQVAFKKNVFMYLFLGIPRRYPESRYSLNRCERIPFQINKCLKILCGISKEISQQIFEVFDRRAECFKFEPYLNFRNYILEVSRIIDTINLRIKHIAANQNILSSLWIKYSLEIEIVRIDRIKKDIYRIIEHLKQVYDKTFSQIHSLEFFSAHLYAIKYEVNLLEFSLSELLPFSDSDDYLILKSEDYVIEWSVRKKASLEIHGYDKVVHKDAMSEYIYSSGVSKRKYRVYSSCVFNQDFNNLPKTESGIIKTVNTGYKPTTPHSRKSLINVADYIISKKNIRPVPFSTDSYKNVNQRQEFPTLEGTSYNLMDSSNYHASSSKERETLVYNSNIPVERSYSTYQSGLDKVRSLPNRVNMPSNTRNVSKLYNRLPYEQATSLSHNSFIKTQGYSYSKNKTAREQDLSPFQSFSTDDKDFFVSYDIATPAHKYPESHQRLSNVSDCATIYDNVSNKEISSTHKNNISDEPKIPVPQYKRATLENYIKSKSKDGSKKTGRFRKFINRLTKKN
ncbi:hypothetical protein CDIK_2022 [Cucumispora dikerogammari]|nr:hypothetical protein CDIK_2022 [Cucumispora dikerogammari]